MQTSTLSTSSKFRVERYLADLWSDIFQRSFPYALALFVALVTGGIIALTEPIFAVLFMGMIATFLLMARPVALLWTLLFMTLVIAGMVKYFIPGLDKIWWATYGMSAMLMVPPIMARITANRTLRQPGFSSQTVLALAFLTVALLSTVVNSAPTPQVIVAVKNTFLFGGVWLALALLPLSSAVIRRWLSAFLLIGTIQWLPALYQYFFVRVSRISTGLGSIEASDSVVGTFGGSMEGGGHSATLGFYLVMLIIMLLAYHREKLIALSKLIGLAVLLVIPLGLMEVKVIFVYLPLALLILYKDVVWRRPFAFFAGGVVIACCLVGGLLAYQSLHWSANNLGLKANIEGMFSYSFSDEDSRVRVDGHLSRLQVATFWWERNSADAPIQLLIGHGLGASKTTGQVMGNVAAAYQPRQIDHTGLGAVLWDVGIIGVALFAALIISGYRLAAKLVREPRLIPWQRSLARGLQAYLPLFLLGLGYRNDIPYAAAMMFLLMTAFGLLAWLKKQVDADPVLPKTIIPPRTWIKARAE